MRVGASGRRGTVFLWAAILSYGATALAAEAPELPKPFATPSTTKHPKVVGWPEGKTPTAPPGFRVSLYAGDVAGVVIDGGPCLPPCPPPDIDLAHWKTSLAKIRALQPRRLALTHWGFVDDVAPRLSELEQRLERWAEWMRAELRAGREPAEITPRFERYVEGELRAAGLDDDAIATYEQADPAAMSVTGLARYWRKLRPEALG